MLKMRAMRWRELLIVLNIRKEVYPALGDIFTINKSGLQHILGLIFFVTFFAVRRSGQEKKV